MSKRSTMLAVAAVVLVAAGVGSYVAKRAPGTTPAVAAAGGEYPVIAQAQSPGTPAPAGQAPAPAAAEDPVVARVNGAELRRSDVVAAQRMLPPQAQQLPLEMIYPLLLDQMVNSRLVVDAGRAAKLADDPDVKKRVERLEDRVIQEVYLTREIEKGATEARLRERYDQFVKENPAKEQVHARHILVETEDEAKSAIADLEKGGDFEAIARERSKGPSKDTGGDLGYFSKDEMVPEFAEAAFGMDKGTVSKEPVKTQFGWHVIKVEDRRTAPPPSFEEAREQLVDDLSREIVNERVKELREKAQVETFAIDGSPMPPKNN